MKVLKLFPLFVLGALIVSSCSRQLKPAHSIRGSVIKTLRVRNGETAEKVLPPGINVNNFPEEPVSITDLSWNSARSTGRELLIHIQSRSEKTIDYVLVWLVQPPAFQYKASLELEFGSREVNVSSMSNSAVLDKGQTATLPVSITDLNRYMNHGSRMRRKTVDYTPNLWVASVRFADGSTWNFDKRDQ